MGRSIPEQSETTIIPVRIEQEVRTSYLNYAMSVIVSRALPDVRDGLKPVHRRILYAMSDMGLLPGSAHKKTGRIVGDVLGKYHPHGDQSIYDALVRLAQDFSLRYPMIDGQGNFGSIDDDPPAAMRYTEARLSPIASLMLRDIKKETVDFVPNYDESMQEPSVLPAAFPCLLANGSSGIAVGMATTIPPHNLNEIANAVDWYVRHPNCTSRDLCAHVKGPDFPTGGIIHGSANIPTVYEKGRGSFSVRGRAHIENKNSKAREAIIITELPYQVSKSGLIMRVADLAKAGKLTEIQDLRDESDKDGMRIVIEIKRGADTDIVLNKLYRLTPLQSNVNANMLALVGGVPQLLTLHDAIKNFVLHRREVVVRRSRHDLKVSEAREHVLEGLLVAINNIDEVIRIIRSSKNVKVASESLIKRFSISEVQTRAILEMRLQKLTSLETIKLEDEIKEVRQTIKRLKDILASEDKIQALIVQETFEIAEKFGDARRTEIVASEATILDREELIQAEPVVFMMSSLGYVKRTPISSYRAQSRGGRGIATSGGADNDVLNTIISGLTTDNLFFVSKIGKAYVLKMHRIPVGSRIAKGVHIRSVITVGVGEHIDQVMTVPEFSATRSVIFATQSGVVKRTKLDKFANVRTRGIVAIKLGSRDSLVSATLSDGREDVFLLSSDGLGLRIAPQSIRPMDRTARGVQGMRLNTTASLVAALTLRDDEQILMVSELGFAKRIKRDALHSHARNTKGQRMFAVSEKTGAVVAALAVHPDDLVLFASSAGNAAMVAVNGISLQQRGSRGVPCITIAAGERIAAVERVLQVSKQ